MVRVICPRPTLSLDWGYTRDKTEWEGLAM